jgi:hypothetical protein
MSYSNPNLQFTREKRFTTITDESEDPKILAKKDQEPLIISGQGVLVFKMSVPVTSESETTLTFLSTSNIGERLSVKLTQHSISLHRNEEKLTESTTTGLSSHERAFYWLSLDAQKQQILFGIGEARMETLSFSYSFGSSHETKKYLESLSSFIYNSEHLLMLRILRDPILEAVPLIVKNTDTLTMDDIALSSFMPRANLSSIGRQLYDNISGKNFVLDTPDFPDFSSAIEHSIATEGCWCHTKLKEKAGEFGGHNEKMVYLRITLGKNGGESPGVPYVMEIWPPGCFSPIHNHAGANAVIRVLHGQINVTLFPYLDHVEPFGNQIFSVGDVTWISPTLNQFHQLKNPNENGPTCITIQCYMYDENDTGHYDYFDYIDDTDEIGHYEPDADLDFIDFKKIMKEEWNQRN